MCSTGVHCVSVCVPQVYTVSVCVPQVYTVSVCVCVPQVYTVSVCVPQVYTVSPSLVGRVLHQLVLLIAQEILRVFQALENINHNGALHVRLEARLHDV